MKKYTIYTDGSDLKHTTHRMGIGGVLLGPGGTEVDRFGLELTPVYLKSEYGTSDCSNPTAEIVAAREALERWSHLWKPGDKVELKADYLGVSKWTIGEWKIKKPYIRVAVDAIRRLVQETGIEVTWTWVKGHQAPGVYGTESYWNGVVDRLAKGAKS